MTSSGVLFCASLRRNSSHARLHRARAFTAPLPPPPPLRRGRFAIALTPYLTAALIDLVGPAIRTLYRPYVNKHGQLNEVGSPVTGPRSVLGEDPEGAEGRKGGVTRVDREREAASTLATSMFNVDFAAYMQR